MQVGKITVDSEKLVELTTQIDYPEVSLKGENGRQASCNYVFHLERSPTSPDGIIDWVLTVFIRNIYFIEDPDIVRSLLLQTYYLPYKFLTGKFQTNIKNASTSKIEIELNACVDDMKVIFVPSFVEPPIIKHTEYLSQVFKAHNIPFEISKEVKEKM